MKCQVMKMAGRRDILMMSMGIRKLSGKKTGWRFQYVASREKAIYGKSESRKTLNRRTANEFRKTCQ